MIALREMIPLKKMSFRLQETLCCVPSSQRRGDSSLKAHKAHSYYYYSSLGDERALTEKLTAQGYIEELSRLSQMKKSLKSDWFVDLCT